MSEQHQVGIAQMKVCDKAGDVLVAANLGSCLAITVYDPVKKIAGLIHCLLPLSAKDPVKAQASPCMYVDSGFTFLLQKFAEKGSDLKRLQISVAGGANINDTNNFFEIGKKNHTMFKKALWKNNLLSRAEDIGGDYSRTVLFHVDSGKVLIKAKGEIKEL